MNTDLTGDSASSVSAEIALYKHIAQVTAVCRLRLLWTESGLLRRVWRYHATGWLRSDLTQIEWRPQSSDVGCHLSEREEYGHTHQSHGNRSTDTATHQEVPEQRGLYPPSGLQIRRWVSAVRWMGCDPIE